MAQFGDHAAQLHDGLEGGPITKIRNTSLDTAPEIPSVLQQHATAPSKLGDTSEPLMGEAEIGMPASPSTTASVAGDDVSLPRATVDASPYWVPAPDPEVAEMPDIGVRNTFVHVAESPPIPESLRRHATAPAQMHLSPYGTDDDEDLDWPAAMPSASPLPQSDLCRMSKVDPFETLVEPPEWLSPRGQAHVPVPPELCRLRTFDHFEAAQPHALPVLGDSVPLPREEGDASPCQVSSPDLESAEMPEIGVGDTFVHFAEAPSIPESLRRHATAPAQMRRSPYETDDDEDLDWPAAMPNASRLPQSGLCRMPTVDHLEAPVEPPEYGGQPHVPVPPELCRLRTFDHFEAAQPPALPWLGAQPEEAGLCHVPLLLSPTEFTTGTPPHENGPERPEAAQPHALPWLGAQPEEAGWCHVPLLLPPAEFTTGIPPHENGAACPEAEEPPQANVPGQLEAGSAPEGASSTALVLLPVAFGTVVLASELPAASPCECHPLSLIYNGDSGAMVPPVVSEPLSWQPQASQQPQTVLDLYNSNSGAMMPPVVSEPLSWQQQASQQPQTVLDPNSGNCCICWVVDARKLRSKNQVVSKAFEITLRSGHTAAFVIMLQPEVQKEGKGGRSFLASKGNGFVQLKCETELSGGQKHDLLFCIGTSAVVGQPGAEPPRGPVQNDFAQSTISNLPKREGVWDFTSCVDQTTQTFTVYLEILPRSMEWKDAVRRCVADARVQNWHHVQACAAHDGLAAALAATWAS